MSPRTVFEQELEQLMKKVAEMGKLAETGYEKLVSAAGENDTEALEALLQSDRQMTDMLRGIEARCLAIMTRQQPVARDLRLVTAVLKAVTDVERIGDHVSDMADLFLRREAPLEEAGEDKLLLTMMREAGAMVRESVAAFAEGDGETARMVIDSDDVVDDLFNRVKEETVKAIRGGSMDADRAVDTLMAAKYLEKVGDHAVNIGEWTLFRITGEIGGRKVY